MLWIHHYLVYNHTPKLATIGRVIPKFSLADRYDTLYTVRTTCQDAPLPKSVHLVAFGCIWLQLIFYCIDLPRVKLAWKSDSHVVRDQLARQLTQTNGVIPLHIFLCLSIHFRPFVAQLASY